MANFDILTLPVCVCGGGGGGGGHFDEKMGGGGVWRVTSTKKIKKYFFRGCGKKTAITRLILRLAP